MYLLPSQNPGNLKNGSLNPLPECFTAEFALFASCGQADYIHFENAAGTKYAAWLDKDADGTVPTGALYVASDVKITCGIATGDTAAQVATKVKAAIEAEGLFVNLTIEIDGAKLYFVGTTNTLVDNAVSMNADDSAVGSIVVDIKQEGSAGYLSPAQDVSTIANPQSLI